MRQELRPREGGGRQPFSRGGYTSLKVAQADLDHIRALLGLADTDGPEGTEPIAAMLTQVGIEKAPLPDAEEMRRRLESGQDLIRRLTVGEWLDQWHAGRRMRTAISGAHFDSWSRVPNGGP